MRKITWLNKITRRLGALFMVMTLLLSAFPMTTLAVDAEWIEISDAAGLISIRDNLIGNYRLTADIDLGGAEWNPIGPFSGKLDGNSKIIKNFTINNTSVSNKGLFSSIEATGQISNLGIENANITAGSNAGILAGTNSGTISQSYTKGLVNGYEYVGGLVGQNLGTIENSFTQASVSGNDYLGGLAGANSGTVRNSYSASTVGNNYLDFNGTTGYINIPHDNRYIGDKYTIEARFKWDNIGTSETDFIIGKGLEQFEIHTGGGSGVNGLRFIPILNNAEDTHIDLKGKDNNGDNIPDGVIQEGWNHVAAIYEYDAINKEVNVLVYLNGVAQDLYGGTVNYGIDYFQIIRSENTLISPYNDSPINIGRREHDGLYFDGEISDVRLWNIARTGTDIDRDKDKVLTGNEPGLVGYWKLNEASGNIAYDSSTTLDINTGIRTTNNKNGTLYTGISQIIEPVATQGGLVGLNTGTGTVFNSYYDSNLYGQSDEITGKTTAEMKTQTTFTGWDLNKIWGINSVINEGYPYLLNNHVYVSSSGSDNNTGSIESPFATINKAIESVSNNGTIYLLSNLTQSGVSFPPATANKTVTIRSNIDATTPYTVSYSGGTSVYGFFDIKNGNILNLHNISIKGDKVSSRRGIYVSGEATLNIYAGVTVSDFTAYSGAGVGVNGATFNMYGGTISGNIATGNGGGVDVNSNGTFNMSGNANISNNESKNYLGGGVYINAGTFNMGENAIIENNSSSGGFGGGVCIGSNSSSSTIAWMYMAGSAIIRNNIASNQGGGVMVQVTGSFSMGGNASISENTANYGGGIGLATNDKLYLTDYANITGNKAIYEGAGVNTWSNDFRISGSVVVSNNLVKNNPQNIRTRNIIIYGAMTEGANVNVYNGSVLKNGYSSDYVKYFHADSAGYSFIESNEMFVLVLNQEQSAPTSLVGVAPTVYDESDGKITGVNDTMEYRIKGEVDYIAVSASTTEITGLAAGTYEVRFKAKTGYNAGTAAEVTVANGPNRSQSAPTSLVGVAPTVYDESDGKITGVNDTMEYRIKGEVDYIAVSASTTEITGLAAGTYEVRFKAKTGYNAGTAAEVTVLEGPKNVQATPSFSPEGGAIAFGSTVTITSAGADAIYYTTDGTNPATISGGNTFEYTAPITVNEAMTIKAVATKAGNLDSAIASAIYTQSESGDLTNIVLSGSPGGLTFVGNKYTYIGVTVDNSISSITVTPTGSGTITVNGKTVTSGNASVNIELTAGVEETITVVSTEAGKSSKTYIIMVTREMQDAPPAPMIQSSLAGDAHVVITWNSVSESTGYKIYVGTISGSYTTSAAIVAESVNSYDATGLENGTTYYFVVKATNEGGDSINSNEVTATPQVSAPGVPVIQSANTGDKYVSINWSLVTGSTGYKIYVSTNPGSYTTHAAIVGEAVNSYDITDLTNGRTYYFAVAATNPGGDSAYSNEVIATPRTVPGEPTNVLAVASNSQATISFTAPTDNGGSPITGYIVASSPGDIEVIGTETTIIITGLTNGNTYTFTVKAVNDVGTGSESSASNSVIPYRHSSGDSDRDTNRDNKPEISSQPVNSIEIVVNGKAETAATETTISMNDKIVTTIVIDDKIVGELLQQEGKTPVVSLPVKNSADVVIGTLNGQTVKNMETKEAVLEVKTESITYILPASQINIDAVSEQLGKQVELKDIAVSVKISEPSENTVKIVENTANKNNYQIIVKPIEFDITCTSGSKTVEVSQFNVYVERMVAIPEGVDPSKITTGIVLNTDGTFSHVPTVITVIDGKYYAKFNSLTNSTYSVIWSPKIFMDVERHWAKDAVNEMGSRLVISGVGEERFEPDRDITRAELAAIVVRGLGLMRTGGGKDVFVDVTKDAWYYDAVAIAYEYGLIAGYGNGQFGPMDKITREQAITTIARAMKITKLDAGLTDSEASKILAGFTDGDCTSAYAKKGIAVCVKTGIISGRTKITLVPKDNITRAEVAVIVRRLLQQSGLIK